MYHSSCCLCIHILQWCFIFSSETCMFLYCLTCHIPYTLFPSLHSSSQTYYCNLLHNTFREPQSTPYRNSRSQRISKIGDLKDFAMFTGKHQRWSLFLIKLEAWKTATYKKETQHWCFLVNIVKFLKKIFLIEHFWWLLQISSPTNLCPSVR